MLSYFRQILLRTIRPITMLENVRSNTTHLHSTANVPNSVWKLGKLNHLAVAVPNLEAARHFFKNVLQAQSVSEAIQQKEHGVYTVFVDLGNTKIELLHPLDGESPIINFLNRNKSGGIHHICIEVDNIESAIKDVRKQHIRTLTNETQIGAHGKPVIFLHPKDCGGILIELEEA